MERDKVIAMTDEEAHNWIFKFFPNSPEFIRRFNVVHWECGLIRAGIDVNKPIKSGELICICE